jgi:hypothetical protein
MTTDPTYVRINIGRLRQRVEHWGDLVVWGRAILEDAWHSGKPYTAESNNAKVRTFAYYKKMERIAMQAMESALAEEAARAMGEATPAGGATAGEAGDATVEDAAATGEDADPP